MNCHQESCKEMQKKNTNCVCVTTSLALVYIISY